MGFSSQSEKQRRSKTLEAHSTERVTLPFTRALMPDVTNTTLLLVFPKAEFRVCSIKADPKTCSSFSSQAALPGALASPAEGSEQCEPQNLVLSVLCCLQSLKMGRLLKWGSSFQGPVCSRRLVNRSVSMVWRKTRQRQSHRGKTPAAGQWPR